MVTSERLTIRSAFDPACARSRARRNGSDRLWCHDYQTADGTCIRDYIHVADIADAHIRALEYLLSGGPSCVLNLANAQGYSVKEVIQVAERMSGKTIRVETAERRPGDPPILIGSASRAKALLEWMPKRSALELQIADAWKWMRYRSDETVLPLYAPS
jgi:UDP-glucose 4-epimerase